MYLLKHSLIEDLETSSLKCKFFNTYEYSKPRPLQAAAVDKATLFASLLAIMSASTFLKYRLTVPGCPLSEAKLTFIPDVKLVNFFIKFFLRSRRYFLFFECSTCDK